MSSNPTPSELHLSHRDNARRYAVGSHSTLAPHLYLAACNPFSNCRFGVMDHLCVNLSQLFHRLAESLKSDPWTCACVFIFPVAFLIELYFSFESLFAICSLFRYRFHYYFYLSIVSWQRQKFWTILILVLCLLCVTPSVCSSYSSFAPSSPFFSSWLQKVCELFTHTLVLQGFALTLSRQSHTTHVFADSRFGLLCHALHICVAHVPPELCPSFLLVYWAFWACYRNRLPLLHHASLPQN